MADDRTRVLALEGTAWAASAAVFETADPATASDADHLAVESEAYAPDSGGIHPREAAEHMGEAVPEVAEWAVEQVIERALDAAEGPLDAVAFSRGPGLGPCLRIVGTAARALAGTLDVPLVGVNHMVAHLEIGRYGSGFDSPVCLNASGANAHLLGYRDGRYRVLGETMDTGVGNALDKFARHLGWGHPGGPKVEAAARDGDYVDLPYVVKGMDFSFSGLSSAAQDAVDDGTPIEDVCRGLEETTFAMLAEVAERALSLTDGDELVLGGGVAQNDRLQRMLEAMCAQRGADLYAPPAEYLRDNAGMIAILGAKMHAAGDHLAIADASVDPNFRPDEVDVSWRSDSGPGDGSAPAWTRPDANAAEAIQGAEAIVSFEGDRVIKERRPRDYRHPALDERLRTERTRLEARLTSAARRAGVPTPLVQDVDPSEARLVLQRVGERELRGALSTDRLADVGGHLARIHDAGFVHGDPTTRNARVGDRTHLIDFGLGYHTTAAEDHAMDLHVLAQSLAGTADESAALFEAATDAYREVSADPDPVFDRLAEIEGRGRYR
jgi:N6-L-threonylcarbamoyladenine synthase/protein kinase Bud32